MGLRTNGQLGLIPPRCPHSPSSAQPDRMNEGTICHLTSDRHACMHSSITWKGSKNQTDFFAPPLRSCFHLPFLYLNLTPPPEPAVQKIEPTSESKYLHHVQVIGSVCCSLCYKQFKHGRILTVWDEGATRVK